MKKPILIVGCLLLLCCCFSIIGGFALLGYFESGTNCVYKGPFSSVSSGPCMKVAEDSTNNNGSNSNQNNTNNNSGTDTTTKTYTADQYTLRYSANFTLDDSDSERLFVYAENGTDNLNVSTQDTSILVTQANCEDYAQQTMGELTSYNPEILNVDSITINGAYACQIDFSADYGTDSGTVNQTQYYVEDGDQTHILTITINKDADNFANLDAAAKTFTLR